MAGFRDSERYLDRSERERKVKSPTQANIGLEWATRPEGGAHTDHAKMAANLDRMLVENLAELKKLSTAQLLDGRYEKFRNMARYFREE